MDTNQSNLGAIIQDWWQFSIFILATVFGWGIGSAKTKWNLKAAFNRIETIETELASLKLSSDQRNVNMAIISTKIDNIENSQTELKSLLHKLIEKDK